MKTYLVGGAVRDALLGLSDAPDYHSDRDWVVVGSTAASMLDQGYQQVGRDFPVFLHPKTKEEYALARTERKTSPGHTGFSFNADPSVTLEDDLARRDLTINAIAQAENGELVDPYKGQQDIRDRVLRHVSPAFSEDPLRVLRVARFAARFHHLGFTIAPETQELLTQMSASGELDNLVAERIWQEMEKALKEKSPATFFRVLRECGALACIAPEVDALFGVPQPEQHHPEIDTGVHILMCLEQAAKLSDDPIMRFATLCHDLGKGTTPSNEWPRHIGHEKRGVKLVKRMCERLRVPKRYATMARSTCEFHTHCHRAAELRPDTILRLFEALDLYRRPEHLEPFLLACEADSRGRTGFEDRDYPQTDLLRKAFHSSTQINTAEIAAACDSPKHIKQAIQKARESQIAQALGKL
ncbi:MAG: multifunctional CCA addition/repair protein [Pseudohongiellaceae bacterium]|nr:multifunctional CCA addition/repair protein [Pseudohongiellaceae bacterium]